MIFTNKLTTIVKLNAIANTVFVDELWHDFPYLVYHLLFVE